MNSQIDEFERIMLDYLKGEISSEDMQKLTILLKRENACREKYREIARSYALASSSWFARRKEQNFEQLCDTLNFYSSRKHSFIYIIRLVKKFLLRLIVRLRFPRGPVRNYYCLIVPLFF